MDILNLILKVEEKNPLDISDLKQCDPYSSFGVFCNANSFIEGIIIIIGVALMFGASMWFVKKNQENVQRGKKNDESNAQ
ncbi:hypothetical protein SULAZ_1427 [Sulfurihydrogenibium azorense Az-Fu1]|jgi:hypothetical protein|uniref:Uncharacterized protein n=1 Tax=Sulfurihydrogenibium azorense (strain DSM 15241 / OCM 825 / Az-Fu1) TaxID=204536 RepID=C1DWA7_SULAA|nr:hypothetical protein [Sulfurihydrogenibium azorense]ACN99045.1 hypothetical protein SULAZ_1427 [Sulfurihydrogenibium azorense Az-Fu1]